MCQIDWSGIEALIRDQLVMFRIALAVICQLIPSFYPPYMEGRNHDS